MKYKCPGCEKYAYPLDEELTLPEQTKMSSKKQSELGQLGCLLPYKSGGQNLSRIKEKHCFPNGRAPERTNIRLKGKGSFCG